MLKSTFGRRGLLALSLFVLLVLVGLPVATADSYYPLMQVQADDHLLGEPNDLTFNFEYMSSAGQAERVTLQTPAGFNASLVQAAGTKLGDAGIGLLPNGTNISASPSAKIVRYLGSLTVMDPTAYASDPGAQACAPGTHTAVWSLALTNAANVNLTLPVAVDASKGGYKLTMCFDALQTAGKEVEWVYLSPGEVFRNPGKQGLYLFDGVVTPFGAAGTTTGGPAYELRAYQALPQLLSASPTYSAGTKTLTVDGKLQADGRPRKDVAVDVYAAAGPNATSWKDLGETQTGSDGSYSFSTTIAKLHYTYIYTGAAPGDGPTCPGKSAEPAGCASISTDGRTSIPTKIVLAT